MDVILRKIPTMVKQQESGKSQHPRKEREEETARIVLNMIAYATHAAFWPTMWISPFSPTSMKRTEIGIDTPESCMVTP